MSKLYNFQNLGILLVINLTVVKNMFGTEVTVIVNCGKKQDSKIVKILLFLLMSCIMGIVKTRKRITDFKISTPPASETTYIYKYMNKIMNVQK